MQGFAAGIFTELRSLGRLSLIMVKFVKLWDSSGYSEIKKNIQEAYLQKTSIWGQIVSEILAQLCFDDSIQILLNLTRVITFRSTQVTFRRICD